MPDISMCSGNGCEQKNQCYRFRANPCEFLQSYFCSPPNTEEGCDYFWPIEGYANLQPEAE